ncbi:MAG: hypothetical protein ACPGSL_06605 [Vicingaceae bacterium]
MEIDIIRKELSNLLEKFIDTSNKYNNQNTINVEDFNTFLDKINQIQEKMIVLKYLLEQQEQKDLTKHDEEISSPEKEVINVKLNVPEIKPAENIKEEIVEPEKEVVIKENITATENNESTPITKLTDTLTLNDRYLFANELFNKDMSAFNNLVKAIDACVTFNEAQNLYIGLDWEIENEHVLSFTNLVEQRFL